MRMNLLAAVILVCILVANLHVSCVLYHAFKTWYYWNGRSEKNVSQNSGINEEMGLNLKSLSFLITDTVFNYMDNIFRHAISVTKT